MDEAAKYGHLKVVQGLHDGRLVLWTMVLKMAI